MFLQIKLLFSKRNEWMNKKLKTLNNLDLIVWKIAKCLVEGKIC